MPGTDGLPTPLTLTPEAIKQHQRAQAKARLQDEITRWNTEGWGAVGVDCCAQCGEYFTGPAYVFDGVSGRDYFCPGCYRAKRDWLRRRIRQPRAAERRQKLLDDLRELEGAIPEPCLVCSREFAWFGAASKQTTDGLVRWSRRPRLHLCSEQCRGEWRAHRRRVQNEQRACDVCGTAFTPKRADARYCSGRCRTRAYRAARRSQSTCRPRHGLSAPGNGAVAPLRTAQTRTTPCGVAPSTAQVLCGACAYVFTWDCRPQPLPASAG